VSSRFNLDDSDKSWVPWAILGVGVLAASVSAILIRYADADEASGIAISFWRSAAGSLLLLPFAIPGLKRMESRDYLLPIVAGVCLAAHFATWITSVNLTSVASSVLLVCTTPIFVAIAARWIFAERLGALGWSGIALALLGSALIAGFDFGGTRMEGNVLALIGAITVSGYSLAGRVSRQKLGILEYACVTYGAAAVTLLIIALPVHVQLGGYSSQTWWAIVALIIGPQLLGHTFINFALRAIDATRVSIVVMAEPVVATILAYFLFQETPSWLAYPGGLAILVGIYLVTTVQQQPPVISE
jgi:drug/metabolite transporter (DMT)-like permease